MIPLVYHFCGWLALCRHASRREGYNYTLMNKRTSIIITHALSAALPLTSCPSLCAINRSDTRTACLFDNKSLRHTARSRASQHMYTVSRYSLSISHTRLSSLMLPPYASDATPSRCTPLTLNFPPLSLTQQPISLSCTVHTRAGET